jgi:cytidylate kinase
MDLRSSAEHLAAALVQATAREQGQAVPAPRFTITLSREVGARGTSVARALGARLGWAVYDNEILERIAQEMKVRPRALQRVDERHASLVNELIESFGSGPRVSEGAYVRHLSATLRAVGGRGECIIVGRGAAHFLPPQTTLRVRLTATLDDRIATMSRELGVPRDQAARLVETTDRERVRFIKDYFHKDPTDPQNYDLVLNASRFSVEECAELIVEALRQLQAREAVSPA